MPTNANGASIWSTPSADVAGGRAYASTGNNYGTPATDTSDAIIAFELGSGTIIWKNQRTENDTFGGFGGGPDYGFGANPVLYETMVDGVMTQLVSAGAKSGGNRMEVFDLDSGAMIKSFPSKGGTVAGTITISNGRVAYGEGLSWSSGVRGSTLTVLSVP